MEFLFIIIIISYVVPAVKHSLFPDQMTRLEKMLRHSNMDGYHLAVDRQSEAEIILTVFNGGRSITTEIDKYRLKEIATFDDMRVLFTYSLNSDSNDVRYLTRTKIEADADLKQVRRLEVTVCGRLADQHAGVTRFDGYEPVYECEVPVKEAVCLAAEPAATSQ
ncbi:MAG: hypothetical protein P8X96_19200 [Desulfobacteraceae bacterium]